ncbi:MAG: DegQ family serine endoprotease [Verrucomicrobiota bacterium]|nr:DegQ family serine endoprotease [Verrucomicrobiota bacterium]
MKQQIAKLASKARLALLAGILMAGAAHFALDYAYAREETKTPPVKLQVDQTPVKREGKYTTSFSPVVKRVSPSVVKVFTSSKPKANPYAGTPFEDPMFRRFFGDQLPGGPNGQMPRQHGLGSGVIVTEDGYILTNNHVIDNADEIKIALDNGDEYYAKVVGKDPKTDIAVLKVEATQLPYITVGDSDQIEVGDIVLAVGNPFGIGQTVTMGMVSAMGRGNMGIDYEDFIQTDAAINPGNSGGALVDAEGRLIGINTAILSRSGGNQGIGFAVPVNLAKHVMDNLVEHGRVIRGFMGVNIQDVTRDLAKEFDIEERGGALVADVTSKSPAEKAGLKTGDVITSFNGKPVKDSRHLRIQVSQTNPGESIPLKVSRGGREMELKVTLQEMPNNDLASNDRSSRPGREFDALEGVTVADMDTETRRQMRLPRSVQGVVVTEIQPSSPAYEAGLRNGDVIQEINRKAVTNAEEAVELSENLKGKSILLRVWSRGGSRYMVVDEDKAG